MTKLLITDIDGTISNDAWRSNVSDYEERQAAAIDDAANLPMVQMFAGLARGKWLVLCLTSRNARWQQMTNKWLLKHEVVSDALHMRENDDYSGASEFKVQAVKAILAQMSPTHMVLIDSRADVVAAYRNEGWSTLQSCSS